MAIEIDRREVVHSKLTLSDDEAKLVAVRYLKKVILKDCEVNAAGRLEHWTSWPHGSGTTTDHGEASEAQKLAYRLLFLL